MLELEQSEHNHQRMNVTPCPQRQNTDTFAHRPFYTQTLLHTDTFTHRPCYTQSLSHTEAITHRRFYTQKLLHTEAFTHRSFYTQTLPHTEAFTHRSFYTQTPLHTQTILHTDAFTKHRSFYTQTLLHTDAFTHRRFLQKTSLTEALHRDLQTEGWTHQQKTSLTKLGNKKLSSSATPSYIISQCLVSSCIILDFQTENTIREFDTWDGHHCRTPWCCKLHASHRSRRKHPQRYNEPNSLVTSTTSCTNLLHTRTIQCKECVLRSLRPRLLRLTSKHHCRIDMQTEQWSSLWTSQFPHSLSHQTNQAPHVLARIH